MKSFDAIEINNCTWKTHSDDYYRGHEAGQQSRQAEVDELRKNFNNALKTIEIQQRFLDGADGANKILTSQASELQKRIDEALIELEEAYRKGIIQKPRCIIDSMKILKGEQL